MRIVLRSALAIMTATAMLLPLEQAGAGKAKAPATRPITASYSKEQCLKDGGRIDRRNGSIICLLPAPAATTVVKSKSNITNN